MSTTEYEGCVCISCNRCGCDCNTGVLPDGDLHDWMNRYGWSEVCDSRDGDEHLCPTCTREEREHIYPDVVSRIY